MLYRYGYAPQEPLSGRPEGLKLCLLPAAMFEHGTVSEHCSAGPGAAPAPVFQEPKYCSFLPPPARRPVPAKRPAPRKTAVSGGTEVLPSPRSGPVPACMLSLHRACIPGAEARCLFMLVMRAAFEAGLCPPFGRIRPCLYPAAGAACSSMQSPGGQACGNPGLKGHGRNLNSGRH